VPIDKKAIILAVNNNDVLLVKQFFSFAGEIAA
jgi:hypothetical protein